MSTLFDFSNPNALLVKATKASATRRSRTVAETVRHSLIHTASPSATLHHIIMAACPHPVKNRAELGEHYMVAYVSIPVEWLTSLSPELAGKWSVSFVGPAGTIQRLPPAMIDMDDVLGARVYIGFDWLRLAQTDPPTQQPFYDKIKMMLVDFVNVIRSTHEGQTDDNSVVR